MLSLIPCVKQTTQCCTKPRVIDIKQHASSSCSGLVPCVKPPDDGTHGPGSSCSSQSSHAPSNDEHLTVKTTGCETPLNKNAQKYQMHMMSYLSGGNFSCSGDLTSEEATKVVCSQDHSFISAEINRSPSITLNTITLGSPHKRIKKKHKKCSF